MRGTGIQHCGKGGRETKKNTQYKQDTIIDISRANLYRKCRYNERDDARMNNIVNTEQRTKISLDRNNKNKVRNSK